MMPLVTVVDIDKRFGGVQALDHARIDIEPGEVHALMGENGAGKSTLGKVLAGVVRPDAGRIELDGRPVQVGNPLDAQRLGIGIIFQELDLFPNLSVAENVALLNLNFPRSPVMRAGELARLCRPWLVQVGLAVDPGRAVGELPIGHQQLVAIARALSMNVRLLVMDESTSSLTDDAVDNLFELIGRLRAHGVAIVYVSHKMEEIFRIADRITVMRDGQYVGTRAVAETGMDELIRMMVGREVAGREKQATHVRDEVLFRCEGLQTDRLDGVDLELRAGEVLGVAGLVGAGRSELGAAMFGLDPIRSGTMRLEGRPFRPASPRAAMDAGLGLLPEDRKRQGLMMRMSVRENACLTLLRRIAPGGFVRHGREADAMDEARARTRIKAAAPTVPVHTLSGGNQQKVLLARWLLEDPAVLFLDDPTRGIDVGAKEDIYTIIEELAAQGKGVVLVSSELPELLRCCDRIAVLHDGRHMGTLDARQTDQEAIMALAVTPVA